MQYALPYTIQAAFGRECIRLGDKMVDAMNVVVKNASKANQDTYMIACDSYECYSDLPIGWAIVEA